MEEMQLLPDLFILIHHLKLTTIGFHNEQMAGKLFGAFMAAEVTQSISS